MHLSMMYIVNTSKNILFNDRDVSASVHGIWWFAKPTGSRWGQRGWNQGLEESHHIIAKSLSSSLIRSRLTRISKVAIPDIFYFWCAIGNGTTDPIHWLFNLIYLIWFFKPSFEMFWKCLTKWIGSKINAHFFVAKMIWAHLFCCKDEYTHFFCCKNY